MYFRRLSECVCSRRAGPEEGGHRGYRCLDAGQILISHPPEVRLEVIDVDFEVAAGGIDPHHGAPLVRLLLRAAAGARWRRAKLRSVLQEALKHTLQVRCGSK